MGLLLVVGGMAAGALAAVWLLMKAAGAEVDYCAGGGGCTSGYVPAGLLAAVAAAAAVAGVRLLRGRG